MALITLPTHGQGAVALSPALVELGGRPERTERRVHQRVAVEVPISVWSLSQPTRRQQLWLPELAPFVASLEVRFGLPAGTVPAGR